MGICTWIDLRASVRSIPFLSFTVPIFAWNVPLVSLIFLERSVVFPILLFSSISLHYSIVFFYFFALFYCFLLFLCTDHWGSLSYLSLLFFGTLHSNGYIFPFLLCLKLKLQCFGPLMWRIYSFEKTLMLGKIEGRRRMGWDGWMASPTGWTWVWASSGSGDGQGNLACCSPWGCREPDTTEWLNWTETWGQEEVKLQLHTTQAAFFIPHFVHSWTSETITGQSPRYVRKKILQRNL